MATGQLLLQLVYSDSWSLQVNLFQVNSVWYSTMYANTYMYQNDDLCQVWDNALTCSAGHCPLAWTQAWALSEMLHCSLGAEQKERGCHQDLQMRQWLWLLVEYGHGSWQCKIIQEGCQGLYYVCQDHQWYWQHHGFRCHAGGFLMYAVWIMMMIRPSEPAHCSKQKWCLLFVANSSSRCSMCVFFRLWGWWILHAMFGLSTGVFKTVC